MREDGSSDKPSLAGGPAGQHATEADAGGVGVASYIDITVFG